jgi:CRP/FNR family nitrogen fixation transcriptional regulator
LRIQAAQGLGKSGSANAVTALEKVGSFILEMETRLSHGGGDSIALPVSRYDIADYLAISVETVSRSLTDLKHRGVSVLLSSHLLERVQSVCDRGRVG